MTLLEVIKQSPTPDYHLVNLYIENNPVYDYKDIGTSLSLISLPLLLDDGMDILNLQELIDFSNQLEYSDNILTLICEDKGINLNTIKWTENQLIFYYS